MIGRAGSLALLMTLPVQGGPQAAAVPFLCPVPDSAGLLVRFLDVGQGDATLLTTAEGRHVLVDGGRNSTRALTVPDDARRFLMGTIGWTPGAAASSMGHVSRSASAATSERKNVDAQFARNCLVPTWNAPSTGVAAFLAGGTREQALQELSAPVAHRWAKRLRAP